MQGQMVQSSDDLGILGTSPEIVRLRERISRLTEFDAPGNPNAPTILLQGETGTGKGLIARAIHRAGPRRDGPFVDVNCAAIPESMLEAELFGFEAGAFTDAKRPKPGLFESASSGILFLDEIDSLPLGLQGKVLGAIEEKRVRRLGAVQSGNVDVKVVVATQRDLAALAADGRFRADLYHRLAVVVLAIPPLRERGDDVVALATHFLGHFAAAHGTPVRTLDDDARRWLLGNPWPGNVRELAHLVERVTLLGSRPTVDAGTLAELATPATARPVDGDPPATVPASPPRTPADGADEAARIRHALARAGGNVSRAARLLGVGRNALRYRMRRHRVDRPSVEEPPPPSLVSNRARPAAAPVPASERPVERKPVAVLVVTTEHAPDDTVGRDPWTAACRLEEHVAETVIGFGGILVERTPTRACAIFGAPRALERSAERAVHAALALAHRHDASAHLRMAVHTGEVRVAARENDTPLILPLGDTVALADRLVGHAGRDEILLSDSAARRVMTLCRLTPRPIRLGPRDDDRLVVHAATAGGAAPEGVDTTPSLRTPFVGRDAEVQILIDAFDEARRGHGQVVFVSGEAGIGKSRLVAEFRMRSADVQHVCVVGRCTPYGTATPFLPIADGVRTFFGIDDRDDDATAAARVRDGIARFGSEVAWTIALIQQLLALPVDDPAVRELDAVSRRSETSRALRTLTERVAEDVPLVLVVEDLHWVDAESEQYLAFLADLVPANRVLLLLTHRPGWAHPFGDRSYHRRVTLRPLPQAAIAAMTDSVLGARAVPDALRSLIAAKAEGNPFFVEEVGRSLIEAGAIRLDGDRIVLARDLADVAVPDTIQEVLLARLERLPDEARRALQIAAVIGREFALRLLARLTEAGERVHVHVDELRSLELVYQTTTHPELAYMFKHALTHDVAYRSVDAAHRRDLHRTIGLVVEEIYADRLAEHYETLAHHFEVGEDWPRAFEYHRRAAEKAAETFASRAVVTHARAALASAGKQASEAPAAARTRLLLLLGLAHFFLSEFAAAGAAYEEAAVDEDPARRATHLVAAATCYCWAHAYDDMRRALAPVEAADPDDPHVRSLRGFESGVLRADIAEQVRANEAALEVIAGRGQPHAEAIIRHRLSLAAEWTGDFRRAIALAADAITLGREARAPDVVIFATWFLGKARTCLGEYGDALQLLREAYDVCDRIGDRAWKSRMLNTIGWCLAEIEHPGEAVDYNRRAAELAADLGDDEIVANSSINLATNFVALGDLDRARRVLEPVEQRLAGADPWMRWRYAMHALDARARIELAAGNPERALALGREEAEAAARHTAPKIEARALTIVGRSLLAMERTSDAAVALRDAGRIAGRLGYARAAWEVPTLLAVVAARAGRDAEVAAREREVALQVARLAAAVGDAGRGDALRAAPTRLRG